jgi:glycosyltransferase involved in cell wall biosynthesis
MQVKWTLHDCWAFTGHCIHFTWAKCEKWKTGCHHCPEKGSYPASMGLDNSRCNYERKKNAFTGVKNMTLIVPSHWLEGKVKRSFLAQYPVEVQYNTLNRDVFKPTPGGFRKKYDLENKKILLDVSFEWGLRKGLSAFLELAKRLPEDYQIVLVGTHPEVNKLLPENIISIHRTQNQLELAEIYSAADLFVNPTREENYPTVNMESIACGTPVLTFRTGGSPEMLDETCGSVVDCDDVDALEREIIRICTDKPYSEDACLKKAQEFDQNQRFKEYLKLYERVVTAGN